MQSIEAEGRTIDDAIARALSLLGAPRERVEIEILANATKGLFGFGGKPARVRASLRRSLAEAAPEPSAAAAPARPDASRPSTPERPRRRPPRDRRPPASSAKQTHDDVQPSPAALERAQTMLTEIVQLCGVEATVQAVGGRLVIGGDSSGVLIGRRGATLDALEYVVTRAIGHEDEPGGHIEVDANNYRARRRTALEALARRMAERARSKGRPVALNPLSPRERRVVHLALRDDPTLTTRSAGSGFYRRLVIVPTTSRTQA